MRSEAVNEIIECLGGEKKVFHYFKGRHCIDNVEHYLHKHNLPFLKINELKNGVFAGYSQKPIWQNNLQYFGSGRIYQEDLKLLWPQETTPFVLGLDTWGSSDRGWDQTTRNQRNLVLQLDFTQSKTKAYEKLVKPKHHYGPFEYWGHPVNKHGRKTLSWVRMDVDFDTDEVLIEEIQNDWLRKANRALVRLQSRRKRRPGVNPAQIFRDIEGKAEDLEHYVNNVLAPYQKVWAEASLCAAIQFIRRDLGISNIFYHTFETGKKIKQVEGEPPRSMYTTLPKQFGFVTVKQAPRFISQDKQARRYLKAIKEPSWFRLKTM